MEKNDLTGQEKAAIFLISMGSESAADIFRQLKESEIEALTIEMSRTKNISVEKRERVIFEFNELMMAQEYILNGGEDYARQVLEQALGKEKAAEIIGRLVKNLHSNPFEFFQRTDPQHLLNFIQNEHPQTIALVLCYLDYEKSALILSSLPHEIQANVAKRIATMERVSPEVLHEVERILERKLSSLSSQDYTLAGGIGTTVEVLTRVDRATEKLIIENLEESDPELADEIKKKMFVFEDIVLLEDRSVQRLIREVDNQDLAKALKSVDNQVLDKIFKNMSKHAGLLLQEDMEFLGPVRLKEVEDCQQRIVNVIRNLEDLGEILITRGAEEDMVM